MHWSAWPVDIDMFAGLNHTVVLHASAPTFCWHASHLMLLLSGSCPLQLLPHKSHAHVHDMAAFMRAG